MILTLNLAQGDARSRLQSIVDVEATQKRCVDVSIALVNIAMNIANDCPINDPRWARALGTYSTVLVANILFRPSRKRLGR